MFPLKDNITPRRFPVITVALIVANVLMFFLFQEAQLSFEGAQVSEQRVVEYGAIPYEVSHLGERCFVPANGTEGAQLARAAEQPVLCEGQEISLDGQSVTVPRTAPEGSEETAPTWLTIITSMFMHGGLLHIAGNMLFLWIFGNNIEDSMGPVRFIAFYLLGGLVAVLAQTAMGPDSTTPTIGASGAVAAVLGGYALLYPKARVVTLVLIIFFITIVELPALLVLGLWFLLQLFYGAAELAQPVAGEGGVAYFAHIGGFVFGVALIKLFANRVHEDYVEPRAPVY